MPNPACQVKQDAGAFEPTTNGVDVDPGTTITIDLIDKGVDSWTIFCTTTDDLSDRTVPNTAIAASINPVTKQATFIAPARGRVYRFQSQVDSGTANGRPQSSYTTTFCVYVPTDRGFRAIAVDETMEGNSLFGWIASFNAIIRDTGAAGATLPIHLTTDVDEVLPPANGGTGVSSLGANVAAWLQGPTGAHFGAAMSSPVPVAAGGTGVAAMTFPASTVIAGTTDAQTLTNKLISGASNAFALLPWSALTTGAIVLPAVTSFTSSVNAKSQTFTREPTNVQTTALASTVVDSFALPATGIAVVEMTWIVTAVKSDGSQAGSWSVSASYRVVSGVVTQQGAALVTPIGTPDDVTWAPTADFTSVTARCLVPGKAAITVQWGASGSGQKVIP